MILLLMLPVILTVSALHRYLAMYAPTNVLVRFVRSKEPRWRTVVTLTVLAGSLLATMHLLTEAVARGAPGWLNLLVLVLAWDAMKMTLLMAATSGRCMIPGRWRGTQSSSP